MACVGEAIGRCKAHHGKLVDFIRVEANWVVARGWAKCFDTISQHAIRVWWAMESRRCSCRILLFLVPGYCRFFIYKVCNVKLIFLEVFKAIV